jgi:hypothetical protein
MTTEVIFKTIHGSHLYGMARTDSDTDMFYVTTGKSNKARHHLNAETGIDICYMGFDTFMNRIYEGSHQSVEALFSPFKVWGPGAGGDVWRDYLDGMKITGSAVFAKYERTIKKFCYGDFKRRRHAGRLALNLADLRADGRFSPVLSRRQIDYIGRAALTYKDDELWEYLT